jgi:hypothetical protein
MGSILGASSTDGGLPTEAGFTFGFAALGVAGVALLVSPAIPTRRPLAALRS